MAKIDDFRSKLTGGGARGSQFVVELTFPGIVSGGDAGDIGKFLVKGASLPGSFVQPIEVPFRGRITKIAGERTFQNWQVTVINDNDFKIRKVMEQWSQKMLEHTETKGTLPPVDYTSTLVVKQLDRNDEVLRTYTFKNAWPQVISDIQLNFGDNQAIEEYNIEFSIDYWTSDDGVV